MKKMSNIILIVICIYGDVFSSVTHCVKALIKDAHKTPNLSKAYIEITHISQNIIV